MYIKVISASGKIPEYAKPGDAGADLSALLSTDITIAPLERVLIPTGLFFEIEPGYEVQIRPRSGLALKSGITVLNTPGTIDNGYRGEIGVILINLGNKSFTVKNNDRIAQMVVNKIELPTFTNTEILTDSERGEGGFGHTGI